MTVTNGYCTLADLKAAARITDAIDDALLEISIESASRQIDGYCQRAFYSTTATRVFNATNAFVTETDDIVSITTVKTSDDGATYGTTWAATDFQLEPLNGVTAGLTQPYTRIRAVGDYLFPEWSITGTYSNFAGVQVTGVFGWASVPTAIRQATILLAMRGWKRYDSPLGVAGFGDIGVMRVGRVDPDVEALLMPFKKVVGA